MDGMLLLVLILTLLVVPSWRNGWGTRSTSTNSSRYRIHAFLLVTQALLLGHTHRKTFRCLSFKSDYSQIGVEPPVLFKNELIQSSCINFTSKTIVCSVWGNNFKLDPLATASTYSLDSLFFHECFQAIWISYRAYTTTLLCYRTLMNTVFYPLIDNDISIINCIIITTPLLHNYIIKVAERHVQMSCKAALTRNALQSASVYFVCS